MFPRTLKALSLAAAIFLAGTAGFGSSASAQGCLSPAERRFAVQSGQVIPLLSVRAQILASGGQILGIPTLCYIGGRLVYMVNVISDGQVTRLQVDGQTGSIGY